MIWGGSPQIFYEFLLSLLIIAGYSFYFFSSKINIDPVKEED